MKRIALAILPCAIPINAQDKALNAFLQTNWTICAKVKDLPAPVQAAIAPISDSGQRFSKGCIPERRYFFFGPDLPFRRLEFGGTSGSFAFAYYEHGGFAHGWTVATFVVDAQGHAQQVSEWSAAHEASIESLKAALRQTQGR